MIAPPVERVVDEVTQGNVKGLPSGRVVTDGDGGSIVVGTTPVQPENPGTRVIIAPPVEIDVVAVTQGKVKGLPSGRVVTDGVRVVVGSCPVHPSSPGTSVTMVPPVEMLVVAVTQGKVKGLPSGSVITDSVVVGLWGGEIVSVVPPVVMVEGAVTVGSVKVFPSGSVMTTGVVVGGGVVVGLPGGESVTVMPPVVMVDGAVTTGNVKLLPSGKVITDGVSDGLGDGGRIVITVPPVVIVDGVVTLGSVKTPPSGRVVTLGLGVGPGLVPGGVRVNVRSAVVITVGDVTAGRVNVVVPTTMTPELEIIVRPSERVLVKGPVGNMVTPDGGRSVNVAPSVIHVEGAVTVGRVKDVVPMMITPPLEMMVWPSDPVVVRTLLVVWRLGSRVVGGGEGLKVNV